MFFLRTFLLLAVVSVVAVGAGSAFASSGYPDSGKHAVIAFVPVGYPGDLGLLKRARSLEGFAIGIASPSLGRDVPAVQAYLDLGQGARVDYSLYGPLPSDAARFARYGSGIRSTAFDALKERAADVPATIEPGLFAETLARHGIRVSYANSPEAINDIPGIPQALAAMDGRGTVRYVGRTSEIDSLLRRGRAVISWLPQDRVRQLAEQVAEDDLLVLIGAPREQGNSNHMLPVAVRGLPGRGTLSSDTTRMRGLITIPDIASSVIDWFGIDKPPAFQGSRFILKRDESVGKLERLDARLTVIEARRLPALAVMAGAVLAMIALLGIALGRRGLRLGVRVAALAAFWLPLVLLLVASLNLSAGWEYTLIAGMALGLSLGSVLFLPARAALIVAIGMSLVATVVDLALGSALTGLSLLGPNPAYGARFFGIGNELEGLLAPSFLIAAGLTVDAARIGRRSWALIVLGAIFAFILGWGRLGADVGGALVVSLGVAVGAYVVAGRAMTLKRLIVVLLVPAVAFGLLLVADLVLGGRAHLVSSVLDSSDLNTIKDIVFRRLLLSYKAAIRPDTLVFATLAALALIIGFLNRDRLLAPLLSVRCAGALAGVAAAAAATAFGFFVNDSGAIVLIAGAAEISLFLGYVWSAPKEWTAVRRPVSGNDDMAIRAE